MNAAAPLTVVERLQGPANYACWKRRVSLQLKARRLWDDVITGDEEPDAEADAKARDLIGQTVADYLLPDIEEAETSREAWHRLEGMFSAATQVRQLDLMQELATLKKGKEEPIQQFISRAKQLAGDLRVAGREVTQDELVNFVAQALRKSTVFGPAMSQMEVAATTSASPLQLERIQTVMLRVEAQHRSRSRHEDDDGMQVTAMSMHAPNHSTPGRGAGGPPRQFNNDKKRKGPCYHCGAMGHLKRECRKLKAEQRNGGAGNKQRPGHSANLANAIAFGATTDHPSSDEDVFMVDSGANAHMVRNNELLHHYREKPCRVTFGNGSSVMALGEGNVILRTEQNRLLLLRHVLYVPEAVFNFVSVRKATDHGLNVMHQKGKAVFTYEGEAVAEATAGSDGLYYLHATVIRPSDFPPEENSDAERQRGESEQLPQRSHCSAGSDQAVAGAAAQAASEVASSAPKKPEPTSLEPSDKETAELWHERMGHISYKALARMARHNMVNGMEVPASEFEAAARRCSPCEACIMGKQTKNYADPPASNAPPCAAPLNLVHMDVMGPFNPTSLGGSRYVATIMDQYTGYAEVFPLAYKSDVAGAMIKVINQWENLQGRRVKIVRSDRGGEYLSRHLQHFFNEKGIRHQLTTPYCPEQNGTIERLNRTLQERARSMLYSSGLPINLWGEAMKYAALMRNMTPPSDKFAATPWELFHGHRPDVSFLRIFGTIAYPLIPKQLRTSKVNALSMRGAMVGYESKSYRIYLPPTRAFRQGRIVLSKDIAFDERPSSWILNRKRQRGEFFDSESESDDEENSSAQQQHSNDNRLVVISNDDAVETPPPHPPPHPATPSTSQTGGSSGGSSSSSDSSSDGEDNQQQPLEQQELRRSQRERRPNPRYTAAAAAANQPAHSIRTPNTLEEALALPEAEDWREAVLEELGSLHDNNTWELTQLPPGYKAIPCKWVFKLKVDPQGNPDRFKARLVAKGFAQREGLDYNEVFAPVSKYTTLRALLAKIAAEDMEIKQADVKTAFLYGNLNEVIYMEQPPGYSNGNPNTVCRLKRSLYGLKQAPRAWYQRLSEELGKLGFQPSTADPALFMRDDECGRVFILAYVDDCLMAAPQGNSHVLESIIDSLQAVFDIRDLGEAVVFLGMEISRTRAERQLHVNQTRYTTELARKYNVLEARTRTVPVSNSTPLKSEGSWLDSDQHHYPELVGSLLYLSNCTRPDIAWSVGALSRYMSAPTKEHWNTAMGLMRYLSGTRDYGLSFGGDSKLVGYCDSDWGGHLDTRRSTSGYVFCFGNAAISWSSKLQRTVALSSCEAEYMAATAAAKEALWLSTLMADLDMGMQPVTINVDNQAALSLIKNPMTTARSKHIDVQYHFVRECVTRGQMEFMYCPTDRQLADIFTKALPAAKFQLCRSAIGVM